MFATHRPPKIKWGSLTPLSADTSFSEDPVNASSRLKRQDTRFPMNGGSLYAANFCTHTNDVVFAFRTTILAQTTCTPLKLLLTCVCLPFTDKEHWHVLPASWSIPVASLCAIHVLAGSDLPILQLFQSFFCDTLSPELFFRPPYVQHVLNIVNTFL